MIQPSDAQLKRGTFKLIGGSWHKRCSGPAHDEPTYLPATSKYFHSRKSGYRSGELLSRCRLCINWTKLKSPGSLHGYIPLQKVRPFYEEAVNRIGLAELARRAGISENHIVTVLQGGQLQVQKATFRKVMLELISMRRKNEYSINGQARWRNSRRMHKHHETCVGCGTPKFNFTKGCDTCRDRHYRWFTMGKITQQEWDRVKDGGLPTPAGE